MSEYYVDPVDNVITFNKKQDVTDLTRCENMFLEIGNLT